MLELKLITSRSYGSGDVIGNVIVQNNRRLLPYAVLHKKMYVNYSYVLKMELKQAKNYKKNLKQ